ncbi:MAG: glycerate kinase [Micropruina sp.]|uniref:glycerate kinase n=1 Tax=Micropruina sp. TaxID=2737536 RepID=UPI0039E571B2
MRIVVAPDKFRGTLEAAEVASALAGGLLAARPDLDIRCCPVADGGEGTLAAALVNGWTRVDVPATGPLGEPRTAEFGIGTFEGARSALVELAVASGLALIPTDEAGRPRTDPLRATSRGTGELIRAALDAGCATIVLGIGGSACTDGGTGLLAALGARFLDTAGTAVPDGGGGLAELARVDLDGLDPRIAGTRFVVACDVDNPLTGPRGSAAVFAPQKGADPGQVAVLDANLGRLAEVLSDTLGAAARDGAVRPGAGAAGGVGYAAMTVLGAEPRPGVDVVLGLVDLDTQVATADLVITGEGSLDSQSLGGKTPLGVARTAAAHGVPVVAVSGRCTLSPDQLRAAGFAAGYALADRDPVRCFTDTAGMLAELGRELGDQLAG